MNLSSLHIMISVGIKYSVKQYMDKNFQISKVSSRLNLKYSLSTILGG